MKIEIVKDGRSYEIAFMPKHRKLFTVCILSKPEIKQLIRRLEKAIDVK